MKSIRIVTLNLWNDSGQVDRRMEVLVPQLLALEPHIVGLQEVRQGKAVRQAEQLAAALGGDFRFAAVDEGAERGAIGNAVVSRLPIMAHSTLALPHPPGDARGWSGP
jgi:endonuclease/exonuclease/phosphatase family metal-dependent hydrolase